MSVLGTRTKYDGGGDTYKDRTFDGSVVVVVVS